MPKFVFTDRLTLISNNLWLYTSVAGTCLTFLVLVLIAVLRIHPRSRPYLDRVSFRILTIALIALVFYGIANALGGSWTGPTWACGLSIFVLQFTLEYASFLIFCIALNLQLVVCHHVHMPQLEQWYIYGSLALALVITVPPYASHQYGWDALVHDCWYSNPNPRELIAWQISTQLLWQVLSTIGELVTAFAVIRYMWKHRLHPRSMNSPKSMDGETSSHRNGALYATAYRGVIARIGLYPFASVVLNVTSVSCVIRASVYNGAHDWTGYRTLLLSDVIYGGRPIVYSLLAVTDPALLNALRALLRRPAARSDPQARSPTDLYADVSGGVHVELTETKFVDPMPYSAAKQQRYVDVFDGQAQAADSEEALPRKDRESLTFGDGDVPYSAPVLGQDDSDVGHGADNHLEGTGYHLESLRHRHLREDAESVVGREMFQKSL